MVDYIYKTNVGTKCVITQNVLRIFIHIMCKNVYNMKQGEILRLKIRGSGNTVEQAAILVGLTRKTLYNYFKQDVLEDDIKELFILKLKINFTHSDTIKVQNEPIKNLNFKNQANEPSKHVHEEHHLFTIKTLAEGNRILAEGNRLLSESNLKLTTQITNPTEDEHLGISSKLLPKFVSILKLIARAGARGWKNEAEALAEISNIFYGDLVPNKEEGIAQH